MRIVVCVHPIPQLGLISNRRDTWQEAYLGYHFQRYLQLAMQLGVFLSFLSG